MDTGFGLAKILLGIATLGLVPAIVPPFIDWMPPPDFEELRKSKQRRARPEGYPWSDLTYEDSKENLSADLSWYERLYFKYYPWSDLTYDDSKKLKRKLSADLSWYERLYLFWTTPVVLFYADKIMGFICALMFTLWFWAHRQAAAKGSSGKHRIYIMPLKASSNLDLEPLQGVELALCVYFGSKLLKKCGQICCAVVHDWKEKRDVLVGFFSSFWNILDVGEIIAFFIGIAFRVSCRNDKGCMATRRGAKGGVILNDAAGNVTAGEASYEGESWNQWSLAYGICLCIVWFRVLRSCRDPHFLSDTREDKPATMKCGSCVSRCIYPPKHAISQVLIPRQIRVCSGHSCW